MVMQNRTNILMFSHNVEFSAVQPLEQKELSAAIMWYLPVLEFWVLQRRSSKAGQKAAKNYYITKSKIYVGTPIFWFFFGNVWLIFLSERFLF